MKIRIDIDCTPEEARRFLGLPDVKAMQDALAGVVEERMREGLREMDPEKLVRTWFPAGLEGMGDMQRRFWESMAKAAGQGSGGRSGDDG